MNDEHGRLRALLRRILIIACRGRWLPSDAQPPITFPQAGRLALKTNPAGSVDMPALVASPNAGVFARLNHRGRFAQVYVEHGAVMWPG
jgi:hypothetical protein